MERFSRKGSTQEMRRKLGGKRDLGKQKMKGRQSRQEGPHAHTHTHTHTHRLESMSE